MILPTKKYTFLDLETSSPSFNADILQIAGLIVDEKFSLLESFDFLIKPKDLSRADANVLKMINYDENKWQKAFELEDVLKKMYSKWSGSALVGWVSHFDWSRLEKSFANINLPDPFSYKIDVASMALVSLKEHLVNRKIEKLSLTKVCEYFGIERGKEHDAYDDAFACYKVFLKLMNLDEGYGEFKRVVVYTDGGALNNPGPAAIGVVIKIDGEVKKYAEDIGLATNNQAEYQAVIFSLKKLKQLLGKNKCHKTEVVLHLDSELVGKQITGEYKIKEKDLQKYFITFWNLRLNFKKVEVHIIPREENTEADKLVKSVLQTKTNSIFQ